MRQPEVPICTPLVASTFGQVGKRAQRFFAAVVRRHPSMRSGSTRAANLPIPFANSFCL